MFILIISWKHSFNKLFIISKAYKVATAEFWSINREYYKEYKPYICVKYFQNLTSLSVDMVQTHDLLQWPWSGTTETVTLYKYYIP